MTVAFFCPVCSTGDVIHNIHNEDGTIGERNSYGNDPSDRRG